MNSAWNPEQYGRFKAERAEPFYDLLALVRPSPSLRVLDLGCGTGELTALLHRRLAARQTTGVDRSAAMLARAPSWPGLRFEQQDIASLSVETPYDLVFSNAALQWLDEHDRLLGTVLSWVRPGGQLAIQVPANHDHPSHQIAARLAQREPFRAALGGFVRRSPVLAPEAYATLLASHGVVEQHVCLRVYVHRLESCDDVVEWVRGTLLTAYEERMPAKLYDAFLEAYRRELRDALSADRPYVYPFKRLLLWARRPEGT